MLNLAKSSGWNRKDVYARVNQTKGWSAREKNKEGKMIP
ncbi:MAG: hypothetical protein HFACDABA_00930 [Anaerolineales bacterium]|nr:hypothetical protein [Anaerolineales bacterium]